jgi:hypothetical protein
VEEREDPNLNVYEDDLSDLPTQALPCTPVRQLEEEYEKCMRLNSEELDLEPAVYIHEGSDLLSQLRDQLAMLPELSELSPKCDIETADVGDPELSTPDEIQKLRSIFLGDGNAAPAPARGVICDLDVGDAKPVAQRPRSIGYQSFRTVEETSGDETHRTF